MNHFFDPFGFWLLVAQFWRDRINESFGGRMGEAMLHGTLAGLSGKPPVQNGVVPQPKSKG